MKIQIIFYIFVFGLMGEWHNNIYAQEVCGGAISDSSLNINISAKEFFVCPYPVSNTFMNKYRLAETWILSNVETLLQN